MRLDELTTLEYEWLTKQHSVLGTHSDRDAAYEQMGAYEAWREIFREYVALSRDGDLEALKRALFLWWYQYSEPEWLSGLARLDLESAKELMHRVNDLASQGQLDEELKWMLPWYYSICDYFCGNFEGIDALKQASMPEGKNRQWWGLQCGRSSFENRGQMGEYWRSICASLNTPAADYWDDRALEMQRRASQGPPAGFFRRICSMLRLRRRIG